MNPLSDSDSYYIAAAIQLQDLRVTRVAPSVFPKLSNMSSSKISVASPRSPMSPTTPRRGIVRKGAAFFSPPKAPKSVRGGLDDSPGGISICTRMKNLQLSPKTPDKKTTKYSVDSPSSGRTLVMNGSQSPNPRRNMKSPTLSSSSSSMGSPMKVMQSPMKGSPKVMKTSFNKAKVMKVHNMKSPTLSSSSSSNGSPMKVMKSPMKGSPKIIKTSFNKAKVMKVRKVVQRAVKKLEWKPTDPNSVMVLPKSHYAPFKAVHGQVKMLKIDLGEAAYLHRDQGYFNKSYGETNESWRSYLILNHISWVFSDDVCSCLMVPDNNGNEHIKYIIFI